MIYLQDLFSNPAIETISITAVIDTALCVGADSSSETLTEQPIVRTADNKLLIRASQIKRCLRHECEKIARGLGWPICQSSNAKTMCPQRTGFSEEEAKGLEREEYRVPNDNRYHCLICQMFGNSTLPSQIIFDDLICEKEPENLSEVLHPNVTINCDRCTLKDKKHYLLETSPANAKLRFKGDIHLQPDFPPDAKAIILAGLHQINALRGSKSARLGWVQWEFKRFCLK
ncbi:MAG: CRISPR-associated protein Csm3 [Symploca sp. SIO2E6]|nr:CRISPR-associated protein Csm3 [Symploca sp. SIO2E6]